MMNKQNGTLVRHGAIAVLYAALSWVFFAPPRHWPGLTYFGYGQDPLAFIWFLNWWPFAMAQHLPLLFTHYMDNPAGTDLVWKTSVPVLGFLAWPITAHFGAVVSYNLLMVSAPALAAFGAYLAAYVLTEDVAAAAVAGLVLGMSGYEIGQGQGHLNLVFTLPVLLALAVILRAAKRAWPGWRLGGVLGVLLALEFGVSQEIFASFVVVGALALALLYGLFHDYRPKLRRLLPGVVLGLGLAVLLTAPWWLAMLRGYGQERGNISLPEIYSQDLLGFILPTPLTWLGGIAAVPLTRHFTGNYTEEGGYFGLPLLLLLGWIVWRGGTRGRALGMVFVLTALLALGPHLHILGEPVRPVPWVWFYGLPLLSAILPCRLALYAWIAAALLLAVWLAERPGWRRYLAVLACLAVLAPAQSFDRNWRSLPLPSVFKAVPAQARVLVLPEFGMEMGWQYLSNMRFVLVGQGYLGTGWPLPFAHWPLFQALWENRFGGINPQEFSAYLATYGVQDVAVLDQGFGIYARIPEPAGDFAAAQALLVKAGWKPVAAGNGILFQPGPNAGQHWQPEQPEAAVAGMAPEHRAKLLRAEHRRVCQIRALARLTGLNPVLLLGFYVARIHPLLPVQNIVCEK